MMRKPTTELSPPYGTTVWASEASVASVPAELAGLEVAAAVAGIDDNLASVYISIAESALPVHSAWDLELRIYFKTRSLE